MNTSAASATQNQTILDALNRCVTACENCISGCLAEEHVGMMVDCIRRDRDCADVCTLVARLVARGSEHARHLMKECMEVCTKCANECAKHNDEHCQQCAAACRAGAAACQQYLGQA